MHAEKRSTEAPVPLDVATAEFCDPIREAVRARRPGSGMARAIHETARFFGLPERRVKAAVYGEVKRVLAAELLQVRQRLIAHLEAEERRLEAQRLLITARRAALSQETPIC